MFVAGMVMLSTRYRVDSVGCMPAPRTAIKAIAAGLAKDAGGTVTLALPDASISRTMRCARRTGSC